MNHPNRWTKRNANSPMGSNAAVTPKGNTYDRYRRLERQILKNLAVPRAAYSYASLLAQIDPAKTGEGAIILNGSIASGFVSRGDRNVRITERGRSALHSLSVEAKKKR